MRTQDEERVAAPGEGDDPAAGELDAGRVAPGQRLGHYRIGERLGAGSMGEVWEARDETLKRIVALKVLPKEVAGDRKRLRLLQREAETLAALDHPNIVTIHSVEEADGVRFITMERVEGKRLYDVIPKGGLGLERIFEIAVPLAGALAAAHDRRVIHRDLKSANIMITTDGRVKVLDFGLAKVRNQVPAEEATDLSTETLEHSGRIVGTVPYMSPEQLGGRQADARSDLFSLGVILYEMATGKRPFRGDSSAKLISSIMRDEPLDADRVREDLPHHLGRIIQQCLVKDPEHRYQAAKDVRNALDALRKEIISGERATDPLPRTRPGPLRLLALVLTIAVVGLGVFTLSQRLDPGENPSLPGPTAGQSDRRMIVVLPLENLGPAEDEYFTDGMTEEIASRLASATGLGVISRTSAIQYKENRPTLRQIGAELGVDYVLEGTVRWQRSEAGSDRVRITPRLIRVADDTQLWSGRYERVLEDVWNVQSEIAERVIGELEVAIGGSTLKAIRAHPTDNLEAYEAYLRGLDHKRQPGYSAARLELAARMLQRAVELDPTFAQAWAELAWVHSFLYFNTDRTDTRLADASIAIDKALELAAELPAVRAAAGYYHYRVQKDYDRALDEFSTALEGLPGNVQVLAGIGFVLRRKGDWEGSLRRLEQAFELDPRDAQLAATIGHIHYAMRRYRVAEPFFRKAVALAPDHSGFWEAKALNTLQATGSVAAARLVTAQAPIPGDPGLLPSRAMLDLYARDYDVALQRLTPEALGSVEPLERADLRLIAALCHARRGDGKAAKAQAEAMRLEVEKEMEQSPQDALLLGRLAQAYALLGRREEALRFGKEAADQGAADAFEGPRFLEMLARIHLILGDHDAAVALLERLLSMPYRRSIGVVQLRLDPIWDPLRNRLAFQELVEYYSEVVELSRHLPMAWRRSLAVGVGKAATWQKTREKGEPEWTSWMYGSTSNRTPRAT